MSEQPKTTTPATKAPAKPAGKKVAKKGRKGKGKKKKVVKKPAAATPAGAAATTAATPAAKKPAKKKPVKRKGKKKVVKKKAVKKEAKTQTPATPAVAGGEVKAWLEANALAKMADKIAAAGYTDLNAILAMKQNPAELQKLKAATEMKGGSYQKLLVALKSQCCSKCNTPLTTERLQIGTTCEDCTQRTSSVLARVEKGIELHNREDGWTEVVKKPADEFGFQLKTGVPMKAAVAGAAGAGAAADAAGPFQGYAELSEPQKRESLDNYGFVPKVLAKEGKKETVAEVLARQKENDDALDRLLAKHNEIGKALVEGFVPITFPPADEKKSAQKEKEEEKETAHKAKHQKLSKGAPVPESKTDDEIAKRQIDVLQTLETLLQTHNRAGAALTQKHNALAWPAAPAKGKQVPQAKQKPLLPESKHSSVQKKGKQRQKAGASKPQNDQLAARQKKAIGNIDALLAKHNAIGQKFVQGFKPFSWPKEAFKALAAKSEAKHGKVKPQLSAQGAQRVKNTRNPALGSVEVKRNLIGGRAGLGPAWTRGEIERPLGVKNMGSWTAAVYTPEQQARLGVDEMGQPRSTHQSQQSGKLAQRQTKILDGVGALEAKVGKELDRRLGGVLDELAKLEKLQKKLDGQLQ